MKIIFLLLTVPMVVLSPTLASGQNRERYIHDIYSESDIVVDKDIIYAENIDFLYSDLSDSAAMVSESADLKQNLASIPEVYYDYLDTATHLKVTRLSMDVPAQQYR